MARTFRSLILGATLLLGLEVTASALRPGGQSVRFTVFSSVALTDLAYLHGRPAMPVPLTFYPTARSPIYEHEAGEPLVLVSPTSGAVTATVELAPGRSDFLLLIEPVRSGVAVTVLDDSPAKFASGNLRVKNLSGLRLTGRINQQNASFTPGEEHVLNTRTVVSVGLRTELHGKSFPACAETFSFAPDECAWLLLLPPLRAGSLEIQTRLLPARVLRARR